MISDVFTCDDIGLIEQILEDIRANAGNPNQQAFESLVKKIVSTYDNEQSDFDVKVQPDCTQPTVPDKQ